MYLRYWWHRWLDHGWHPVRARAYAQATYDAMRYFSKHEFVSEVGHASAGISLIDRATLHHRICQTTPQTVLEYGSGISSYVIASALKEVQETTGRRGHLTTLEHHPRYYQEVIEKCPQHLRPFITFLRRPRIEGTVQGHRGVWYEDAPVRRADFVFVDGPPEYLSDGTKGACLDVARLSERPREVLIDGKRSTIAALRALWPDARLVYDRVRDQGILR